MEKLYALAVDLRLDYVAVVDAMNWMVSGDDGFEEYTLFVREARKYAQPIKNAVHRLCLKLLSRGIILGYTDATRKIGNCYLSQVIAYYFPEFAFEVFYPKICNRSYLATETVQPEGSGLASI